MKKSFLTVLLLFAVSAQSVKVMAGKGKLGSKGKDKVKIIKEKDTKSPNKTMLYNYPDNLPEDEKDKAKVELKIIASDGVYYDTEEEEIHKASNFERYKKKINELLGIIGDSNFLFEKSGKKDKTLLQTAVNNINPAVVEAILSISKDDGRLADALSSGKKTPLQIVQKGINAYNDMLGTIAKYEKEVLENITEESSEKD